MKIPRFLLTAGASGSGKTLVTCGILQAFKNRGLDVVSFKCGPDYIDPMFHAKVIGTKSANLDTFFTKNRGLDVVSFNAALIILTLCFMQGNRDEIRESGYLFYE